MRVVALLVVLALLSTVAPPAVAAPEGEAEPGTLAALEQSGAVREAPSARTLAAAASDSGFGEKNRFVGRLGYSADALGQTSPGGSVLAEVPAGATVRLAYLYGSYHTAAPTLAQRTIVFGGIAVELVPIPNNIGSYLSAARADVTAQVTQAVGGGGAITPFRVDSNPPFLDGVALLVVYEHPDLPVTTIAVIDGGASQAGQRTTLTFTEPLDPDVDGFTATMSLGIGYGYQGGSASTAGSAVCGTGSAQSSIVEVNNRRLTSCAGNYDDGFGTNGALITVGGIGDSVANPSDPHQEPGDGRQPRVEDDELYDLAPFITAGDREMVIDTANPSFDDIIFLTVIEISARIRTVTSVPVEQTFGGGSGLHGRNPTGYQADPVNSLTGFYVHAETDAVFPTRGGDFRLDRSYTSGDDGRGMLGRGWSSTWDVRLLVGPDAVTLVAEDGQRLRWERDGDALFPPAGARSELTSTPEGFRLRRHDRVVYRFDAEGRLLDVRDRNGLGFVVERGADGRLTAVVDEAGRRAEFTVNDAGRLLAVGLPDGRRIAYGYDGDLLVRVTDVRGGETTYGYDDAGRLDRIVDPSAATLLVNTYSPEGRVVAQVDAFGSETSFEWDEITETSTMTDANGGRWQDVYADGLLVRRVDPLGATTPYAWDDDLNLVAVTDPGGNTSEMSYDARGNLIRFDGAAPVRPTSRFSFDASDNLTSTTDPNGATTTFDHDAAGNLVAVAGPLGDAATLAYDGGLPSALTDRRGGVTTMTYDERGNLVSERSPSGRVTAYAYDDAGRLAEVVEPDGARNTFTYDAAGNLVEGRDALGHTTRFTYDDNGRRTTATDANGHTTRYVYDEGGRIVAVTGPDGATTRYEYDAVGHVVSRTDANGHTTRYTWDLAGRVTAVTLPTGQRWALTYDAVGNAVRVVTPRGADDAAEGSIDFSYDALGRLVGIDYADDTPDVAFEYDPASNRVAMTDALGRQTYEYDAGNRLTAVTRGTDVTSYRHDADGNIVERRYPDGREVRYEYDPDGLLATVTDGQAVTGYEYDAAGRPTKTTHANGTLERRAYDAAGRLTGVRHLRRNGRAFDGWDAALDPVGNVLREVRAGRSGGEGAQRSYAYDDADRLVRACFAASCPAGSDGAAPVTYDYDPVGNLVGEERPGQATTYAYDAADRLVRAAGPDGVTEFAYDANGNRARAGEAAYEHDLAGRLVEATVPGSGGPTSVTYGHDGDGALRSADGHESLRYLWDIAAPVPLLALERDADGATVRAHTHGHDLVTTTGEGEVHTVHQDRLGSVTSLSDPHGIVRARFHYGPYGALEGRSGRDAGDGPAIGFAGALRDPVTDFVHLQARTYDPATAQFLQRDPVAATLSSSAGSAYAYVGGRPTVLADPTGQCPWCVLAGVGAVVGGAIGGAAYALTTDDFSWREFGGAVAGGAVAGAVTGVAGPLGGSIATGVLGASSSAGGAAIATTAVINGIGGAAAVTAQTTIGHGRVPTAGELALGAGANALGGYVGNRLFPMHGVYTRAQAPYFAPRTWNSLISGGRNITAVYRSAVTGSIFSTIVNVYGSRYVAPRPLEAK